GRVVQETRLFDANRGVTQPMRSKEEAHDYRYFPEPDLVPLCIDQEWIERVRQGLPELPDSRRQRFTTHYGLPDYDAEVLTASKALVQMTDSAALEGIITKILADNASQVADYRAGKQKVFGFFVGQTMKATQGKANPALVNELLRKLLD